MGKGARYVAKPFSSRLMTAGMTGGLGNVSGSPEAVKLLKQGIRNNDDVAEAYLNRVRPELRGINNETAGMVDSSLTSRINVPETIAAERAMAGELEDFTNGATFYHTKAVRPRWAMHKSPCYEVGNHLFYNDIN